VGYRLTVHQLAAPAKALRLAQAAVTVGCFNSKCITFALG